jgi:hypothetical protein
MCAAFTIALATKEKKTQSQISSWFYLVSSLSAVNSFLEILLIKLNKKYFIG